ncbi:MAG: site-specific integrase [Gallionella sp.]|nr:site-specific integrase [Gallionella sp.]
MPLFKNYIDIHFTRGGGNIKSEVTRIFFTSPTSAEIADTEALRMQPDQTLAVLGARMPYMYGSSRVSPALYDFCLSKDFSEDFSKILVRLFMFALQGRSYSKSSLSTLLSNYQKLIRFLVDYVQQPSCTELSDVDKDFWLAFACFFEKSGSKKKADHFGQAKTIFARYQPTALGGWLAQLRLSRNNDEPAPEHNSELADAGYSNAVMYQIIALCLEAFQRRIGYLKRYETLTESDMPSDWLYPGRDNQKPAHGIKRTRLEKGEVQETESFILLSQWLNDEDLGYQTLIDHFILHHKSGLIIRSSGGPYTGGIQGSLKGLLSSKKLVPQVMKFFKITARSHGFQYQSGGRNGSLLDHYLKKKTATEQNVIIDQIGWCLANLLMIQTGINKEVAMSMPSIGEDGRSILLRKDPIFVAADGEGTDAALWGYKERSKPRGRKVIPIQIPLSSPLYKMLLDYERYVKVDQTGPFLEFGKSFVNGWSTAGRKKLFTTLYPIYDDNGNMLNSIETPRFRKVFATRQLLDRIAGIKDANDLAEKIRDDLNHERLDTTLNHYLLKTHVGRSVIDIAIATITSEKLAEALCFKGKIALTGGTPGKRKVFLCECDDPTNPSHDAYVAGECKHYDLCLGCERSTLTAYHLPYICLRILQYEDMRKRDPAIWSATFEDRWMIAHNALDQYILKDQKNGQHLVDEAWSAARDGRVSLPPIINSNRM